VGIGLLERRPEESREKRGMADIGRGLRGWTVTTLSQTWCKIVEINFDFQKCNVM